MIQYYLEEIEKHINQLYSGPFDNWSLQEIDGYKTACEAIMQKVQQLKTTARLDSMDDHH